MKEELSVLLEELYDLMDRFEELAEDDDASASAINEAINKLSEACDILENK